MWLACPKVLDETATILGFAWQDYAGILGAFVPLLVLGGALWGFGLTALLALTVWLVKRGKPPGAVLQALHGLEIVRLPGLLPARPTRYTPW